CTGSVFVSGGQLLVPNQPLTIGGGDVGQLTVSGTGFVRAFDLDVCQTINSVGTFTLSGGTVEVLDQFLVGDNAGATGYVWITGGSLIMTNPIASNVGDDGRGLMVVSN